MGLTFLRHTTPAVDKHVCYGQTDLDLAPSFPEEARAAGAALSSHSHIFTSPLKRCIQLADFIGKYEIHQSFIEMDFGTWELQPWNDIARSELDAWADDFFGAKPHGGESVAELRDRVAQGLSQVPDGSLIVTHNGVIKAAAALRGHPEGWDISLPFGGSITL